MFNRKTKTKALIIGAGHIGTAIANFLQSKAFEIEIADVNPLALKNPLLESFSKIEMQPFGPHGYAVLEKALSNKDYVINAGPHYINHDIRSYARMVGVHYFDLSEDIKSTQRMKELAEWTKDNHTITAFCPQCGLAPGYISILANHLAQSFDEVETIQLRVGALSKFPNNRFKYNLTWSTEGLVNEYANSGIALENGKTISVPPLSNREELVINGQTYEAFSTSGGVGTLPAEVWG